MFRILKKNIKTGKVTIPYAPQAAEAPGGFSGAPVIDPAKCTGCGQCVAACPSSALAMIDKDGTGRTFRVSYGDCIFCALCGPACPHQAISFNGKFKFAARTKKELRQDLLFPLQECRKDKLFISGDALPVKTPAENDRDFSGGDFAGHLSVEDIGRKLKDRIRHLFGRSLHIREVDAGSCNGCEVEAVNLSNPFYDAERFGVHFVASPRHADMLLVTGPVTRQMELALVKTYEAAPSPKLVVACGSCAVGGGIFNENYAVTGGVDRCVPVDVYVPGCPPRPEAILEGIFLALDKLPLK
ncbi:MAG: Formate hydrogenlyase subunit 7 [Candidatus Omnitrophica bacterium ADurb.Bin277]|jgi:Ni,Fe-hydrogenase III small subunit/formate hydrogenlyase subunit 6/NADH:ubiquinone oxidoreductase subunit I|nr:MAG: Formate hydrogenlyase subunit 7 [Candidatus Omnitrophica bacterium ADurb.Bin277]